MPKLKSETLKKNYKSKKLTYKNILDEIIRVDHAGE